MYNLIIKHKESLLTDVFTAYDVSTLSSQIEHYTSIDGQPGKLSFILEKDPNDILQIAEGDVVEFTISATEEKSYKIFKGYIFTLGTDSSEAYKITAYDQTRYLKNKDVLYVQGMSVSDLFNKICKTCAIPKYKVNVVSEYIMPPVLYNNKSYYEMLDDAIHQTLVGSPKHPLFFIRDNFGVLELDELTPNKTNYILGDESLLTDYQFEIDIDKETYNRVMVIETSNKDNKGEPNIHFMQDVQNIMKYGVLQTVIPVQSGTDKLTIERISQMTLQLYNKPKISINLNAVGIVGLDAGKGFILNLKKLNVTGYYMYINSAIHRYDSDTHTMELDVSGFASLSKIPEKPKNILVNEILNGEWGNGDIRKNNIIEAGYNYDEAQTQINELFDEGKNLLNTASDIEYVDGVYKFGTESTKIINDMGYDCMTMNKVLKIMESK